MSKKENVFEDDFDKADHVGEIRRRPSNARINQTSPNDQMAEIIANLPKGPTVRKPALYTFTPTGRIDKTDQNLLNTVPEQQKVLRVHEFVLPPASTKCAHDWPETEQGADLDGSCAKCGISFMAYVHMECP